VKTLTWRNIILFIYTECKSITYTYALRTVKESESESGFSVIYFINLSYNADLAPACKKCKKRFKYCLREQKQTADTRLCFPLRVRKRPIQALTDCITCCKTFGVQNRRFCKHVSGLQTRRVCTYVVSYLTRLFYHFTSRRKACVNQVYETYDSSCTGKLALELSDL
jgi:hypothetical protein